MASPFSARAIGCQSSTLFPSGSSTHAKLPVVVRLRLTDDLDPVRSQLGEERFEVVDAIMIMKLALLG